MNKYKNYEMMKDINDWEYLNIQNIMTKKSYVNKENKAILHHLHQTKKIFLPIGEVILSSYNQLPKKRNQKCSSFILHIISRSVLKINENGEESKSANLMCGICNKNFGPFSFSQQGNNEHVHRYNKFTSEVIPHVLKQGTSNQSTSCDMHSKDKEYLRYRMKVDSRHFDT